MGGTGRITRMPAPKNLRPKASLVVRNATVARCDRGASDAGILPGGAVAVDERRIVWVGRDPELDAAVDVDGAKVLDARGALVTPGLVDSHTHLVFAGERAGEFALRASGRSYLDTALSGGGIAVTTRATQAATDAALVEGAATRARRLLAQGVTTVEVKSGYGLTAETELRLLRIIHEVGHLLWREVTIVPTFLAHAVPPERQEDPDAFVGELCDALVPRIAREKLAVSCDVFHEEGAFTAAEAQRILEAARARGLVPRIHADHLRASTGARIAAELGCASADHLEWLDDAGIEALARRNVVAGLLPLSTLSLGGERWAPASESSSRRACPSRSPRTSTRAAP
jgi:imidazolonepropionase